MPDKEEETTEKLRFEFTILPSKDNKSNLLCISSIATSDNKIYTLPEELQSISYHKEILKSAALVKVKNSLKKRHQTRRIWITMTEELKKTYIDEDGNMQFENQYLEEVNIENTGSIKQTETSTLEKLLDKIMEKTQPSKQQNLKNIADKFVLEKFTSRNTNATQWIEMFERECMRFDVETDENKIEILRLFMDRTCADWHSSMILKHTIDSDWLTWKTKFCESFANKGWNPVTYALLFKYKDGSLIDYAMRKEKLLLDMRRTIDPGTLVDLIAAGLPEFILNRIDRERLKDTVDLYNEVSKYEHMVNKKTFLAKKRYYMNSKTNDRKEEKHPCKTCERLNKGIRYHPENMCWFKINDDENKTKKSFIRHVNNSVIETELNENDQKNE